MRAICCALLAILCGYLLDNCIHALFQEGLHTLFNILLWIFLILAVVFMILGM